MAFREVRVFEVREVLRLWLAGESLRGSSGGHRSTASRSAVVEAMDYSYALMDLTVFGRQETWEDSPRGWPQPRPVDRSVTRTNERPTAQWSRLEAGRSEDLGGRP